MSTPNLNREYGSRYAETRTLTDLGDLAEQIIIDLPQAGIESVVPEAKFSIHVIAGVLLHLHVGGLSDEFTFSDKTTRRYSKAAIELINLLTRIVESYSWRNAADPTDRRFVCSIYLLAESDFRTAHWTPGVVRVV